MISDIGLHCLQFEITISAHKPGHVAQSVAHLTQEPEVSVQYWAQPQTFVSPSADLRRANIQYWRKYKNEVLVNRLGGLSPPRKNVVRLTDHPDMTIDVYCGSKRTTTTLQKNSTCPTHEVAGSTLGQ